MSHSDVAGLLRRHGYTQLKKIGEGSFGKALLVEAADGSKLICKMVDVSKASKKEQQDAVKEGRVLADLSHQYIVRYRENFQESGWLCIVMDFCEGGDLTGRIKQAKKSQQPLPEDQILRWFTQAILALKYIHDKHILHRDLKPSNFFLSKSGSMQMGDFGISKVLACTVAVARTQIGTPYYLSPELCQENPYTWPSDIWAMGCILYELCALKVPFDAANIPSLVEKICRGSVPQVPDRYSPFVRQLCSRLLNRDPKLRPSTDEILEMPEIKAVIQSISAEEEASAPKAMPPAEAEAGATPQPPYQDRAGRYSKGDLVEYNSTAHKEWLPATIIDRTARAGWSST
jgi:NIMA (never in mitosis gene a)-related kinase